MDDRQKLRERAWAAMKDMHDNPGEQFLTAADGWCAPGSVAYGIEWQPGPYQLLAEFDAIMGRTR